ncbi:MAG TPA: GNAT family N-acetyltransferase [Solirubrobacteraceae bacterium]|jgi:ribosomal protein S18 acetylase RimI-like enzyme|nr:GNAT family N-acetyltransferase [Solirubrobacteraceae bacterium]
MRIVDFAPEHLEEVVRLCEREGWTTFTQAQELTLRALQAPGVVALVAAQHGGEVIGFAYALSDGVIQAYLACLVVADGARRRGVGRGLLEQALARSGARRIDLLSADSSAAFYESFPHQRARGYRIASAPS